MRIFHFFIESINWLRIVVSPALIGLITGGIVYLYNPNLTGKVIGIIIALTGLIIGIIWASNIWKTMGTTNFFSGVRVPPDQDKIKSDKEEAQ